MIGSPRPRLRPEGLVLRYGLFSTRQRIRTPKASVWYPLSNDHGSWQEALDFPGRTSPLPLLNRGYLNPQTTLNAKITPCWKYPFFKASFRVRGYHLRVSKSISQTRVPRRDAHRLLRLRLGSLPPPLSATPSLRAPFPGPEEDGPSKRVEANTPRVYG